MGKVSKPKLGFEGKQVSGCDRRDGTVESVAGRRDCRACAGGLEPEGQWEHSKTEAAEGAEMSPCRSNQ